MPVLDSLKGNKKSTRGHMPLKRTINLANTGEKQISLAVAIPACILIILGAGLISKFAVIDRFNEVSRIQRENYQIQQRIDGGNAEIDSYASMVEEYAHYTYEDMTSEELSRADRAAVMDLIRLKVSPVTPVSAWAIDGNRLVMTITGFSLESVNNMVLRLEDDELVDYCSVATASQTTTTSSDIQTEEYVVANVEIYLKNAERGMSAS